VHEDGGDSWCNRVRHPLGAALVAVTYFPLHYPKMGVLWLGGASIQPLGWGDIGTWGNIGTSGVV